LPISLAEQSQESYSKGEFSMKKRILLELLFSLFFGLSGLLAQTPWSALESNPSFKALQIEDPQAWYQSQLFKAFRKIIPFDEERDPLERLVRAISEGAAGRTELEQVLKDHHASSLREYLQEIDGLLNKNRTWLRDAERRFEWGVASSSELEDSIFQYSRGRLTVAELAVLLHFYQSFDSRHNQLIIRSGLRRADAETARYILAVTKFPYTAVREHGENQPLLEYTSSMKKDWRESFLLFLALDKRFEFDQIWSQMVNQNTGNKRFRHIAGFEERFIWEVRRLALSEGEEFLAQDLLISYLSNYSTNSSLDKVGEDPSIWSEEVKKRLKGSLADFIARFAQLKNREQLNRFFESGALPSSFPENYKSIQVKRVLTVIATAKSSTDVETCMASLSKIPKYQ